MRKSVFCSLVLAVLTAGVHAELHSTRNGDEYRLWDYNGESVFCDGNAAYTQEVRVLPCRDDRWYNPHVSFKLDNLVSGSDRVLVVFYTKINTEVVCDDPEVNATRDTLRRGNLWNFICHSGENIAAELLGHVPEILASGPLWLHTLAGVALCATAGELCEKGSCSPEFKMLAFQIPHPTRKVYAFDVSNALGPLVVSYSIVTVPSSIWNDAYSMMFSQWAECVDRADSTIWNRVYNPAVMSDIRQPCGIGFGQKGILKLHYTGPTGLNVHFSVLGPEGFRLTPVNCQAETTRIRKQMNMHEALSQIERGLPSRENTALSGLIECGSGAVREAAGIPLLPDGIGTKHYVKWGVSALYDLLKPEKVKEFGNQVKYIYENPPRPGQPPEVALRVREYKTALKADVFKGAAWGVASWLLAGITTAMAENGDVMTAWIPNAQNGTTYLFRIDNPTQHPYSDNSLFISSDFTFAIDWMPGSVPYESQTVSLGEEAKYPMSVVNSVQGIWRGYDDFLAVSIESQDYFQDIDACLVDDMGRVLVSTANPDTAVYLSSGSQLGCTLKVTPLSGEPGTIRSVRVQFWSMFGTQMLEKTFNTCISGRSLAAQITPDHAGGNYSVGECANFVVYTRDHNGVLIDPDQLSAYFPNSGSPVTLSRIGVGDYRYQTAPLAQGTDTLRVIARKDGRNAADARCDIRVGLAAPPTPAGLSATAGNRQVTLNWTANPTGTHRYRVYRSLSGGGEYALIDSVYHPTTTYVNTGLTNGVTYYYRLSAVNSAGQASALSGNVPAIPRPPNGSPVLSDHTTPSGVTEDVPVPFEVKYADPDGNSPAHVRVRSTAGGSSVMVWSRPFPPDYRAGVVFYGGLAFPRGSQGFYFEASDGITTTRYPASGSFPLTVNPRPPEQPLELDSVRVSPKIISPLVSHDTADKCTLSYKLNSEATVKIEVLNSGNTVVRTVVNWDGRAGGVTSRDTWNGRDNGNSPVSDGSYFFRVRASNFDEYVGTMLQGAINMNIGDIAVDSLRDRMYIADYGSNVIRVYSRAGSPIRTFSSPYCSGVGVEYSTGYIYVAEWYDRRVRVYDQYGNIVRTLSPNGGGTGQFYNPIDVTVDQNGNLYVLATKNVFGNPCAILKYRSNLAYVSEDTCSTILQQARIAVGRGHVAVTGLLGPCMQFRDTNLVRRHTLSGYFGGVAVDQNGHVVVCNLQGHGGVAFKYDPVSGELLVRSNPYAPHIAFPVLGVDVENPNYILRACEARVIRTKNGWAQAAGRIVPIDPMQVQVDNSPPEAELMYPGAGDTLSDLVRTLGTAQDVNFKQYALEYYSSADGSWSLISTDTVSVDSGPLGDWNTNALPNGNYRLRLLTSDDAYNLDSVVFTVRVDHTPPGITLDTVFPTVFSPNGDGTLDTATVEYTLTKNALVTASVLDANNAVVRTLVNGQPRNAGPHTVKWDGKNNGGGYVCDGQYRLVLFASDSVNNPSVAETSVVTVDRAKPTVTITSPPSDSLASGLISFVGTATDANPLCRRMYYGTGASPDSWVRWDSAGSVVVDGLLAMFGTLNITDTIYTFRLVMDDQAGNRDSASVRLHVDNSQPEPPVLLSPHDTAAFPGRSVRFTWGSTRFAGTRPLDADSVTYTFQLGRDFRFIACDTTVTLHAETTWQCPWSLADTTYYWHVRATDNAGNVGYYQNYPNEFAVDNTPPTLPMLIEPEDSTVIEQDTTVTFRWFRSLENGSGIRGYVLRLSDNPEFVAYRDTLVRDTACVLDLADSLYYWKVSAVDRAGNTSGFTTPRRLVKDTAAPSVPALVQPADRSTVNDSTPRFVWRRVSYQGGIVVRGMVGIHGTLVDEYGSPVRYTLECALDPEFERGLVQVTGITDTAFDLPDSLALADTTYFWRVEAVDAAGHRSGFSDPWQFCVKAYFDISGAVRYFSSQLPVESASVVLSGFRSDTAFTGPTGAYSLLGFPVLQNYAVTPYRIEHSRQDAVSAYDAAMVLLHTVHRDTLDSLQFVAGNVTGDTTISSLDASMILQYTVGRIQHFPAGGDTTDWAFRPRQRTYVQPTQDQASQDYCGILFGDPSGTWRPAGRVADEQDSLTASQAAFYCLNLPDCSDMVPVSGVRGRVADSPAGFLVSPQVQAPARQLVFPLVLQNAAGVVSVDAEVRYCAGRLTLEGLRTTPATSGFMVAATDCDGLVRVAMAGSRSLDGVVPLLEMVFRVRDDNDAVAHGTLVEILSLSTNEGRTNLGSPSEGAMGKETALPSDVTLGLPLPNPAAGNVRIEYGLPKAASVRLSVFDIAGRPVRTLVDRVQSAGRYVAVWDGEDNQGHRLPSGVYFLRIDADGQRIQRRAVLLGQ